MDAATRELIQDHIEARRGLGGGGDDTWLAGMIWSDDGPTPLLGTLDPPAPDAPIIARFHDGAGRWSDCMCVQHVLGDTYINCIDGTVLDREPDWTCVVFSGVAGAGSKKLVIEGEGR